MVLSHIFKSKLNYYNLIILYLSLLTFLIGAIIMVTINDLFYKIKKTEI